MNISIIARLILYFLAAAHAALGCFLIYTGRASDIKEVYKPKLDEGSKIPVIAGIVLVVVAIIMAAATYFA